MRKLLYVLILTTLMLTACGTSTATATKESVDEHQKMTVNKDDVVKMEKNEGETNEKAESAGEKIEHSTQESNVKTKSNSNTKSLLDNSTSTPEATPPKTSNDSATTQKPSNDSGTTQTAFGNSTTTKKPIERIVEEVSGDEITFKYGVVKYDKVRNDYMVYSDGSKELLDTITYTYYDKENYQASNEELRTESDSNATKYMSYYQEVLSLVNEIRAEAGVTPLTLDTTLCKAASMRAIEMDYSDDFMHSRPSGEPFWSAIQYYDVAYSTCGENIAAGQMTPQKVVNSWKNSPGHYQNMINPSFTKLGVGYSGTGVGDYGHYWCQLFTN